MVVLEGALSIKSCIHAKNAGINGRVIEKVIYTVKAAAKHPRDLAFFEKYREKYGYETVCCEQEEIERIASGSTHGGFAAVCGDRTLESITNGAIVQNGFYAYLDGMEDPYNFGQALRSLYAAGADGVIVPERNWMTAAGTVCRASAGASELLPMYSASDGFTDVFTDVGYRTVKADSGGVSIYEADLKKPLLLIVGGEKRGISSAISGNSDITVTIPYGRSFSSSLPACSAATVIAFEILRQNRK